MSTEAQHPAAVGWALIIRGAVLIVAGLSLLTAGGFGRWFSIIVVAIGLSLAVPWALTSGWPSVQDELRA